MIHAPAVARRALGSTAHARRRPRPQQQRAPQRGCSPAARSAAVARALQPGQSPCVRAQACGRACDAAACGRTCISSSFCSSCSGPETSPFFSHTLRVALSRIQTAAIGATAFGSVRCVGGSVSDSRGACACGCGGGTVPRVAPAPVAAADVARTDALPLHHAPPLRDAKTVRAASSSGAGGTGSGAGAGDADTGLDVTAVPSSGAHDASGAGAGVGSDEGAYHGARVGAGDGDDARHDDEPRQLNARAS